MSESPRPALGEQTNLSWRKQRAGQRMFLGFQGTTVSDDFRKVVAEIRPAGFVLFKRNVEEPRQVLELNRELASLCKDSHPAFLAVDQEGGRVQRIKEPATVWPPMRAVGHYAEGVERVSATMARELRAMGFNLNFAPVADVDSNPDNPIIGDRSFSRDPAVVAGHVRRFIMAHQQEGVIACAKHFPGHGDTAVDSHLDLPWVDREEGVLREVELVPFQAAVRAGVGTVMTSHVMYPAWDKQLPATLSKRIIQGILREEMGFQGVVFSDDLEMKAIADRFSVEEQVCRMTESSVDIFLCCESHTLQLEVFRQQVKMQERFESLEKASMTSDHRVHELRLAHLLEQSRAPDLQCLGAPSSRALADDVRRRAKDFDD